MARRTGQWNLDQDDRPADVTPSLPSLFKLRDARARAAKAKAELDEITDHVKAWFTTNNLTAGTADGVTEAVVTCRPTDTFQGAQFAKDHPDLAAQYAREVTRQELDVAALRRERPEVWARYRSSALKVNPAALEQLAAQALDRARQQPVVVQPPTRF